MPDEFDVNGIHRQSSGNRDNLEGAARCGCFYCCAIFSHHEIRVWADPRTGDERGTTALCPYCGIDAVIPMAPDMDADFLRRMNERWF